MCGKPPGGQAWQFLDDNLSKAQEQSCARMAGRKLAACGLSYYNGQDVVHDAKLKAASKISFATNRVVKLKEGDYDPKKGPVYPWFRSIVRNAAEDLCRKQRRAIAEIKKNPDLVPIEKRPRQPSKMDILVWLWKHEPLQNAKPHLEPGWPRIVDKIVALYDTKPRPPNIHDRVAVKLEITPSLSKAAGNRTRRRFERIFVRLEAAPQVGRPILLMAFAKSDQDLSDGKSGPTTVLEISEEMSKRTAVEPNFLDELTRELGFVPGELDARLAGC
jgi:DNA-directed RNA polymerase specialized sigma24 family protein